MVGVEGSGVFSDIAVTVGNGVFSTVGVTVGAVVPQPTAVNAINITKLTKIMCLRFDNIFSSK
jgi:hypothetical protein